jgi:cytochrome c oxidase cbb3-type subunit III
MKIPKRVALLLVIGAALVMGAISQQAAEKPDGAELFRAKCSMCHGVDGKGFAALKTPDFTSSKWQDSVKDSEILDAIKNGKKGTAMPAFSDKMSEKEILAVLRQVREFGKKK